MLNEQEDRLGELGVAGRRAAGQGWFVIKMERRTGHKQRKGTCGSSCPCEDGGCGEAVE